MVIGQAKECNGRRCTTFSSGRQRANLNDDDDDSYSQSRIVCIHIVLGWYSLHQHRY